MNLKRIWIVVFFYFLATAIAVSCFGQNNALPRLKSNPDTASINTNLAIIADSKSRNVDSLITELKSLSELAQQIDYRKGLSECYFQEGILWYRQNNYKAALQSFNQANQTAKDLNDALLTARCLERMASVTLTTGDDHQALKLYYEALPLFEMVADKEGIAKVYNILGLYKSAQKEFDSSEMYYRKAIRLNEDINNQTGIFHNKGNLAYLYEKMGEYEKAGELYADLIQSLIEAGDSTNLTVIYYNVASLYEVQNQLDSTRKYLHLAIRIAENMKDTSMLSALYGNYGDVMMQINSLDSAYYFLEKAVKHAQIIGDANNALHAHQLLFSIDTLSGKHKRATSRFAKIIALKDTVYQRKIKNNLKASELRYENQKKDIQIQLQKTQLKAANRQKLIYRILFIFLAISGILLGLIIYLLFKNNRKKRSILHEQLRVKDLLLENTTKTHELHKLKLWQAEEEIRVKENEQISHALALEQKNELLGMINSKIVEAMKGTGILKISELNGIVASIKAQLSDSADSDLFNKKFSQLHKDFYTQIKNTHPDLTKSELKFCAFLKINLSGSQIAKIQNVTAEAIRKTRYRIRKKLGLSPDESLEDYISRF